VRVLTHAPGATLLDPDPDVAEVRAVRKGDERAAVVAELERRPPDLVVSTTRYDGIAEEIERRVPRSVTDLWRRPPPDEPVAHRYHRILAAEGLVRGRYAPPRIHLTAHELSAGHQLLAGLIPAGDAVCASGIASPQPGDAGAGPRSGDGSAGPRSGAGTRPRSGLRADGPVVLVPDAGMAVKRWPHQDRLVAELTRRAVPVLVLGRDVPPLDLRALAALFAAVGRRGGVVVGADTGPVRVAAATGARTVGLFGPTVAARYGLDPPSVDLQGLPGCPHRRPTAITEQVCWWDAACPLAADGPACMADLAPEAVLDAVLDALGGPT
jgi:hypothetical protein